SMSLTGVALLYYGYGALGQAFGLPLNSRTVTDCLTLGFTRAVCESKAMEESLIFSIVGFGFGASLVALFAQLGGGIYTKAADVGRAREDEAPMTAVSGGCVVASVLAAILFGFAAWAVLQPNSPTTTGGWTWAY